jgi:hypothetical protein
MRCRTSGVVGSAQPAPPASANHAVFAQFHLYYRARPCVSGSLKVEEPFLSKRKEECICWSDSLFAGLMLDDFRDFRSSEKNERCSKMALICPANQNASSDIF